MEQYNVTVELASTATDEETTDPILDGLRGMSPAISWSETGHMQVTVTIDDASGMEDAMVTGMAHVLARVGLDAKILRIETMTTEEFDARAAVTA